MTIEQRRKRRTYLLRRGYAALQFVKPVQHNVQSGDGLRAGLVFRKRDDEVLPIGIDVVAAHWNGFYGESGILKGEQLMRRADAKRTAVVDIHRHHLRSAALVALLGSFQIE